ncbi:ATP-binding cassette, subfamily C [Micromonospora nigra]|uniref:ATP-binding cassette, subfamily C n=1 Tax=Micromonospora nigra TaxID=145857 RepID=A0A1C6RC36_9ACTN|nr:ABC transporter ATP-binding protein [Micromonospora nigra]SCL14637.1 ATP-binding cassette, subfamily C [Micromonospora nigra]
MTATTSTAVPRKPAPPVVLLITEALRTDRSGTAALLGALACFAVLPAGLAIASGALIGSLDRLRAQGWPAASRDILLAAAGLGLVFLLQLVLPMIARAVAERVGRALDRAVSGRVVTALAAPAGLERLEDPASRELLAAVRGGVIATNLRDAVTGVVNIGLVRAAATLSALVLLGYRWWVALGLLAAYCCAMVVVSKLYQRQLVSADGTPAGLARALYLKSLVTTAPAAKEVRVFGLADWLLGGYRGEWVRALRRVRTERSGVVRVTVVSTLAVAAGQALVFVPLAADLASGALSPGRFTAFAVAAVGCGGFLVATPDLLHIGVGGETMRAVRELERANPATLAPAPRRREIPRCGSIVFDGVGFRYPHSAEWVLRGLDLTIEAAASTAIVGVNGAGKTTLVKLLCGFYQPTEGRILVDGVDLRELDPDQWQRHCAALFQDWIRWGLPLRDNVLLGAPGHPAEPHDLDRVARSSGLDEVIGELPAGWATVLSREFDGVDLSGGQWQRVGLARALWAVHAGAGVLLLDEPTSALDVRGEAELYDLLLAAAPGRTVVLISHRFSTVRRADQIVVLAGGRVVERGDHHALMAAGGEYAAMFTVQAQRFRTEGDA